MSLQSILEETAASAVNRIPAHALEIIKQSAAKLEAAGIGDNAIKAGDHLPKGSLIDAFGKTVSIDSLLAKGPLMISYYRGGWCPYCNLELKAYQQQLSEIHAAGGQLVAITPELADHSLSTVEKNQLTFPVLTDQHLKFADALGISFELPKELQTVYAGFGMDLPAINGTPQWVLPIPAVYVVKADGEVVLSYVDRDYTKRLEPVDAVNALRAI